MYPSLNLPLPPSSVVTGSLATCARPPIGVMQDDGSRHFDADAMGRIVRLVAVSGDRRDVCFLAQAHPYFHRETDDARVRLYFETQVARLQGESSPVAFHALFSAMLLAMHSAGDRLPVDDRLYFLTRLTDCVTDRADLYKLGKGCLSAISSAGDSLRLDPQSKLALIIYLMAGHRKHPDFASLRRRIVDGPLREAAMLEPGDGLPQAYNDALELLAELMSREFTGGGQDASASVFVAGVLSRIADWPPFWKAGMLRCLAFRLGAYPSPVQLQFADQLFHQMLALPEAHRDAVSRELGGYIYEALTRPFEAGFTYELMERVLAWLPECEIMSTHELACLFDGLGALLVSEASRSLSLAAAPEQQARFRTFYKSVMALGMRIPADRRGMTQVRLLALAPQCLDDPTSAAAFNALWDETVGRDGAFACLYRMLKTLLTECRNAPDIIRFLVRQVERLPEAERFIIALSIYLKHAHGSLKPEVADAILAHLPAVHPDMRSLVLFDLLIALNPDAGELQMVKSGRWSLRLNTAHLAYLPQAYIDATLQQLYLADKTVDGADRILKRILQCLQGLDEGALAHFLNYAKVNFDEDLLHRSHGWLLDIADGFAPVSRRRIAVGVLSHVSAMPMAHPQVASSVSASVDRAFGLVGSLPDPVKAEALYQLCQVGLLPGERRSTWGGGRVFHFLLAALATLPMQERGRVLYALACSQDLRLPEGANTLELFRGEAALLDADIRDAWLVLIELRSINPESRHADAGYADFLRLKARCAGIADAVQRFAVMKEIGRMEAAFRNNPFLDADRV